MLLVLIVYGCGKKSTPKPPVVTLAAATLILPAQNEPCTTGQVISGTQSIVTFTWNTAANAIGYDVHVNNLLTGSSTVQSVTGTTVSETLLRNTPYSWSVVSKSAASGMATSEVWKFYNAGPATTTYAPFPADLVTPTLGQNFYYTTTVNLAWTGSSVDNDITGYDIYFGTTISPPLFKSTTFINLNVPVSPKTTYYWKVITKDANGNTSDSGLFQFTNN